MVTLWQLVSCDQVGQTYLRTQTLIFMSKIDPKMSYAKVVVTLIARLVFLVPHETNVFYTFADFPALCEGTRTSSMTIVWRSICQTCRTSSTAVLDHVSSSPSPARATRSQRRRHWGRDEREMTYKNIGWIISISLSNFFSRSITGQVFWSCCSC